MKRWLRLRIVLEEDVRQIISHEGIFEQSLKERKRVKLQLSEKRMFQAEAKRAET